MPATRIGLALGGGGARGAAHLGVIRELAERGIVPDVVCGTSSGAIAAAALAADRLVELERWLLQLRGRDLMRAMDPRLIEGGLLRGDRVRELFGEAIPDVEMGELRMPFGAVAADLTTGREVWLTEGSLLTAVCASSALPGLFAPVRHADTWLGDGGLVDPVPVSLCRSLGATTVVAVDLNRDLLRHMVDGPAGAEEEREPDEVEATLEEPDLLARLKAWLLDHASLREEPRREGPSVLSVVTSAVNIVENRITRARMAGDPPELLLEPKLGHLGLLDYECTAEAIEEGRACVERARSLLDDVRP